MMLKIGQTYFKIFIVCLTIFQQMYFRKGFVTFLVQLFIGEVLTE